MGDFKYQRTTAMLLKDATAGHHRARAAHRHQSAFNGVNIASAEVRGSLSLIGTTVDGDLLMNGLRVGRDLLLNSISGKSFLTSVLESLNSSFEAIGLKFGADATTHFKSKFAKVDLTGASVQGEFP